MLPPRIPPHPQAETQPAAAVASADPSHPTQRTPNFSSKALFYPSASAALAPSSAGAGTGTTITYHLITPHLALLALIPTAMFEARRGLIEYNVVFFREGVQEICEVEADVRAGGG